MLSIFVRVVDGKTYAYSEDELTARLKGKGIAQVLYGAESKVTPADIDGKNHDEVNEYFSTKGGGQWLGITLKTPYTSQDNMLVEQSISTYDPLTGIYKREGSRWDGAVIARAVYSWELDKLSPNYSISEEGYGMMPMELSRVVRDVVIGEVYGGSEDPAFL